MTAPSTLHGPYYQAQGSEVELFMHASQNQLPVLIKGPTGCGKTRFVEHMAENWGASFTLSLATMTSPPPI